ncbi:MAG: hypothetical protein M3N24_07495 [Actinomycetota bacterium]|nr:hypothetical protein [Actinomycetota bacterium]
MRVRRWRLFAAGLIFSVVGGSATAVPAAAETRLSFSGRSFAVKTVVSSTTTVLADTGELPSSGGTRDASALSGTVADTLVSTTLHASTIGQGDRVRSEASAGGIGVTAGLNSVSADFAMSRAMARSMDKTPGLSGVSHVSNLIVNGVPILITGQANQVVPLINGQLVINEQVSSVSGNTGSITVNALHLTVTAGPDVVLASSRAGVVADSDSRSCSPNRDFATGGGWLPPAGGAKRTFGFVAGIEQREPYVGHLVFVNHLTNERLEGRFLTYEGTGPTRDMTGTGQFDGQPATFELTVTDGGEGASQDQFFLRIITPTPRAEGPVMEGGNIQVHAMCQ